MTADAASNGLLSLVALTHGNGSFFLGTRKIIDKRQERAFSLEFWKKTQEISSDLSLVDSRVSIRNNANTKPCRDVTRRRKFGCSV